MSGVVPNPVPELRDPRFDIARRPPIDPEVLAVLALAADQVWPRPRVAVTEGPKVLPACRFSGRWWSRPTTARRDRPRI